MVNLRIIDESKITFFQESLLSWFENEGRNFYWRENNRSNYEIMLSEIFLQRTKAKTISKFIPIFVKQYPTWKKLANASMDELKYALRPIGLYEQRGERLYLLAQTLAANKGEFPKDREEIMKLPMMGQYLTNAYELYVQNKRSPLLDVNMARLLERFFGKRKLADIRYDPFLQTLAYRVVNVNNPKMLNWAILDYASLVCSRNPDCYICILNNNCLRTGL